MTDDEFQILCDSISERGQLEPIVLDNGQIIDGRNRMRACEKLGIEPMLIELEELYESGTIGDYVYDKNIARRQLSPQQKAAIFLEMQPYLSESAQIAQKESQFQNGHEFKGNRHAKVADNQDSSGVAPIGHTTKPRGLRGELKQKFGIGSTTAQNAIDIKNYLDEDEKQQYLQNMISDKEAAKKAKEKKQKANPPKPKKLTEKQWVAENVEDEFERFILEKWIPISRKIDNDFGVMHLSEAIELMKEINYTNLKEKYS